MFTVYLRHEFQNGGEGRIWGGATGNGDGILGALWDPARMRLRPGKPRQLPDS